MTDRDNVREMLLYLSNRLSEKEHQLRRAKLNAHCWSLLCCALITIIIVVNVAKFFKGVG